MIAMKYNKFFDKLICTNKFENMRKNTYNYYNLFYFNIEICSYMYYDVIYSHFILCHIKLITDNLQKNHTRSEIRTTNNMTKGYIRGG